MGKKRPVKRPTENRALAAVNREAKSLGVDFHVYLRFIRERGQVIVNGRIDASMRASLHVFADWQRDRDLVLFN